MTPTDERLLPVDIVLRDLAKGSLRYDIIDSKIKKASENSLSLGRNSGRVFVPGDMLKITNPSKVVYDLRMREVVPNRPAPYGITTMRLAPGGPIIVLASIRNDRLVSEVETSLEPKPICSIAVLCWSPARAFVGWISVDLPDYIDPMFGLVLLSPAASVKEGTATP